MQWPVNRRVYSDAAFLSDLQDTIALLKGADVDVALQFINFR